MILVFVDIFRDDERLYPSRSVRLSNNKLNLGPENKKPEIKKLVVLVADPSFLYKSCMLLCD